MEISLLAMIGIGLAAMFFGYFFGLFEGRNQGYKKHQNEDVADRRGAPAPPEPGASPGSPGPPDHNMLELGHDEKGQPLLRIDGRRVEASIMATEQRRRLIDLMVMLRPWVDPGAARAPSAASASAAEASPRSMANRRSLAADAQERQPSGSRPFGIDPAPLPTRPPASLSLVAQIDAVLQARLAGTPLASRGIRLAEALHGGAVVFVGTTQYDSVDRVPDPAIQAAIRGAIAEWENRYTPG
ncbi:MAG: hypothetical protein V1755_04750 [Chloroflexota bacterium]